MARDPLNCQKLAQRLGSWLDAAGPESDVVISCRMRLARNLDGYAFMSRLGPEQAVELSERLREHLLQAGLDGETRWIAMSEASAVLRLMLRERHLISRDLAPGDDQGTSLPGRAVAFGRDENISVMVNEEDHLRIQGLAGGFDLDLAWKRACDLDRELESHVKYACHQQFGYLTGCPTNVGTGLRASVMLHLPGLGLVQSELEKVFTAAQRTGLAVRGLYGEGTRAAGDFFQISNQVTLGRSEADLIDDLRTLVPVIVRFERKVRQALFDDQEVAIKDRVMRSHGMLRTARSMATEDALAHLSNVRLGYHLGLDTKTPIELLNELGVQVQRGHIQALLRGDEDNGLLEVARRDELRASYLRQRLASVAGN